MNTNETESTRVWENTWGDPDEGTTQSSPQAITEEWLISEGWEQCPCDIHETEDTNWRKGDVEIYNHNDSGKWVWVEQDGVVMRDRDHLELLLKWFDRDEGWSPHPEPIHDWFGLSYAQYLTIPRSALQSMPLDWQLKFVEMMRVLDKDINWRPEAGLRYIVKLCEIPDDPEQEWDQVVRDPLADYERGRRRLELRSK